MWHPEIVPLYSWSYYFLIQALETQWINYPSCFTHSYLPAYFYFPTICIPSFSLSLNRKRKEKGGGTLFFLIFLHFIPLSTIPWDMLSRYWSVHTQLKRALKLSRLHICIALRARVPNTQLDSWSPRFKNNNKKPNPNAVPNALQSLKCGSECTNENKHPRSRRSQEEETLFRHQVSP